jgi:hypothetical protein
MRYAYLTTMSDEFLKAIDMPRECVPRAVCDRPTHRNIAQLQLDHKAYQERRSRRGLATSATLPAHQAHGRDDGGENGNGVGHGYGVGRVNNGGLINGGFNGGFKSGFGAANGSVNGDINGYQMEGSLEQQNHNLKSTLVEMQVMWITAMDDPDVAIYLTDDEKNFTPSAIMLLDLMKMDFDSVCSAILQTFRLTPGMRVGIPRMILKLLWVRVEDKESGHSYLEQITPENWPQGALTQISNYPLDSISFEFSVGTEDYERYFARELAQ